MATGNMAECFGTVIFEGVRAIGVLSYRTIKRHFGEHPVENLLRFFANKKMRIEKNGQVVESPRIGKVTKTLYGYHILIRLYPGLCLQNINRLELQAALNAEIDAYVDSSNWVHLRVYTKQLPKLFPYRQDLAAGIRKYPCAVPVGISRKGFIILDLSRDELFALLIGGQPGFGKSEWIRQALTSVVLSYSANEVVFYLVDMKDGIELETFQDVPHTIDWSGDLSGSLRVLKKVQNEITARATLMKNAKVSNIKDYNKKMSLKDKMPHAILVIDEYASLDKEGKYIVEQLCQKSRFAGIHPVVCTQRPSHKILSGDTKALMPVGLSFRVKNELNSKMILGEGNPHAAYLREQGRAVFQTNRLHEVQVMALNKETADSLIREKYPQKKACLPTEAGVVASW